MSQTLERSQVDVDEILRRARRAATRGEAHWALQLFKRAALALPDSAQKQRRDILLEMLDLEEEEFGEAGPTTLELAAAHVLPADLEDSRILKMQGWSLSRKARGEWKARASVEPDAPAAEQAREQRAIELARTAAEVLERATLADAAYGDAWGTLGGVWRQMADWHRELGREVEAADFRQRALDAYEQGSKTFDPYPTLTFFEERAVVQPTLPLLRSEDERHRLSEALRIRRKHFLRGQQVPWAAFDMARGRYYLEGNQHRFFEDLNAALDQAIAATRNPDERHAVETTLRTLQRLATVRTDMPALALACELLKAGLTDSAAWVSGDFLSLQDPVLRELRRTVPRIEALRIWVERSHADAEQAAAAAWEELRRVGEMMDAQLGAAEEVKLQAAIADLKSSSVWVEERLLRFIWKHAGPELAKQVVTAGGHLPVAGGQLVVKVLASIAGKLVTPG